jgi:hypothetical protein
LDLITDEMKAHPAWASWCKLVQLFSVVIQHKLSVSDVERILTICSWNTLAYSISCRIIMDVAAQSIISFLTFGY